MLSVVRGAALVKREVVCCGLESTFVDRGPVLTVRELTIGRIGRSSTISGYEGPLRVGVHPA